MTAQPKNSWIICHGAERAVRHQLVRCPLGGQVDVERCLGCHLLETLAAERDRGSDCFAAERSNQVGAGNW